MGIPGSANPMLFGGAAAYQINQSLRFNWADSTRLYRTFGSNNSNANFTVSFWCKRAALNEYNAFLAAQVNASNYEHWMFYNDNAIGTSNGAGGVATDHKSTALFRDPSAWYHVVWKNVASGSTTVYVNNVQMLSFTRGTKAVNGNYNHNIGVGSDSGSFGANFYLAEYHLVDGSALEPSSFAETDTITGAWIPKKYSGSYGTNGFYLKFDPSATNGIGHDHSGNGNNFTATGFVTSGTGTDVMSDTPTNNWCTFNPLNLQGSTLSNGNLNATMPGRSAGTFAVSSGKWYWECTYNAGNGYALGIGIANVNAYYPAEGFSFGVIYYGADGSKYVLGTNSSYSTSYSGGTFGIALDLNSAQNTIEFFIDGTSKGVINISSGITWTPLVQGGSGSTTGSWDANFGQRAFAYTPPTGYKALNTANLPEPTIKKGDKYFDTKLYTGTGGSQSLSGLGFQPDLVWIKARSTASSHGLYDAVRGVGQVLLSNSTSAEQNYGSYGVTSFNSAGFSVNDLPGYGVNDSGQTYAAWCWDANGAGSSNTAGTITSTVSANATAGFSIVTYTGTGSNATVGHGLGVAPSFYVVKNRNTSDQSWYCYHKDLGASYYIYLNLTAAAGTGTAIWNGAPSSSVFTLGTSNAANGSTMTYVAYCFSEVAGYSKFGSYTGNGSSDGPFVFCNFRPAWIMIKDSTGSGNSWYISDNKRNTYNVVNGRLMANLSNDESTSISICDFTSNGFKIRTNDSGWNTSSSTYIFAAFSETAFKFANAR